MPFHPTKVGYCMRYHPAEVHAFRRERVLNRELRNRREPPPGAIAAAAFKLFNEGKRRRDVVLELELEPERAQQLWRQWKIDDFEQAESIEQKAIRKAIEAEEEKRRAERLDSNRQRTKEIFDTLERFRQNLQGGK